MAASHYNESVPEVYRNMTMKCDTDQGGSPIMQPKTQHAFDRALKQVASYQPPDKAKPPKSPPKAKASKS